MPIIAHNMRIEPPDDAEIWRFFRMEFFRDLMANEELYFRRTDCYKLDDPNEGLPTDDYVRQTLGINRYIVADELELNHQQASNRLHSECYYLSCWNLANSESVLRMWYRYAPYGVAVRTDYRRLKATLGGLVDDAFIGKVRYGDQEMRGYNALQILFTKRKNYFWENEVRAVICSYDPVGGQARNYRETNFPHREPQDDLNPLHPWVHECKRRRIRLNDLVLGIVMSPWARRETIEEVRDAWALIRGYNFPVSCDLQSHLTPTIDGLKECGWGVPGND